MRATGPSGSARPTSSLAWSMAAATLAKRCPDITVRKLYLHSVASCHYGSLSRACELVSKRRARTVITPATLRTTLPSDLSSPCKMLTTRKDAKPAQNPQKAILESCGVVRRLRRREWCAQSRVECIGLGSGLASNLPLWSAVPGCSIRRQPRHSARIWV